MKTYELIKPFLKGKGGLVLISLLFAIISTGAKLSVPLVAGIAIDLMVKGNPSFNEITKFVILIASLACVGGIFRYFFDLTTAYLGEKIVETMRNACFSSLVDAPISYLDQQKKGDLVYVLSSDIENIKTGLVSGAAAAFDGVVAILFTLVLMFYLNWIMALAVVLLTPLSVIISRFVSKGNAKYFKEQSRRNGELSSFAKEGLDNISAVRTLNLQKKREEEFSLKAEELRKANYKAMLMASLINPSTRLVNNLIYATVVLLGASMLIFNFGVTSTFTVGALGAFLSYALSYMTPFNEVADVMSEISYAAASLKKVVGKIKVSPDIDLGTKNIEGDVNSIKARDVFFSYDGKRDVISNFSINIAKGMKIALVGPTGCGKTTLLSLLMRFYDPNKGAFYFNDCSTLDISKEDVRARVGMVLQETWIFSGSVKDNISYGKKDATLEEIKKAAEIAQASSFIERLPQGYDTIISDGTGLSVGERQLLCVARAILVSPEIVILDEATSNIDLHTESLLKKSFDALMEGKTSIVVAHRLSTIINSDLIVVMKDGEMIEKGNHAELMGKNGFYKSLYEAQFH